MWLSFAFISALFMGCYDISKKLAVNNNAILPVLFFNSLFSIILLLPLVIISRISPDSLSSTILYIPEITLRAHGMIFIRSAIVSVTWLVGFNALKHLPITITGPIFATRPVMTLMLAFPIFGERLNLYQWIGVIITVISLFLFSSTGKKEGVNFISDKWIYFAFIGAFLGSACELYEKAIMPHLPVAAVLFWFSIYQCIIFFLIMMIFWYPKRKDSTPFEMRWSILAISIFVALVDLTGLYAISEPDSMISVISLMKRSSVLVSFVGGAIIFHEKNLKGKIIDLVLIIIGMLFLFWGTR